MAEYEEIVSEIPEYSPKSEFSKARVVEQVLLVCSQSRANEMKEGYFNTKLSKEGLPVREWIPDSRERFFGSVHALLSLLSPEIQRDKIAKTDLSDFEESCEDIKNKYIYDELKIYSEEGILKYKKTGNKFLPPIDSEVIIPIFNKQTKRYYYESIKGGWNDKTNAYKNELVEVYDYIFSKLNNLIDRLGYFKPGAMF